MSVPLRHSLFRLCSGSTPTVVAFTQLMCRFCLWLLVFGLFAFGAQSAWAQPTAAPLMEDPIAGNIQATIKWGAVSGATIYDVYQSTDSSSDGSIVTSPSGTSVSRTGLINGTTYYFKVCARNSSGSGPLSAQVAVTPVNAPVISERLIDNNSVTLKWGAVVTPNLSYYEVLRKLDGTSDAFALVDTTTALTYTDTGVVNDTKYQYRVRVANPVPNTNLTSGTVLAQPIVTPTIVAIAGKNEVTIRFTPITSSTSATQYHLFVSTDPAQIGTYSAATNEDVFNYTGGSQQLVNGTKYYFRIRPYTGLGTPAYSNQVACTPINGPILDAPILGSNSVSLKWSAVSPNPEANPNSPIYYEVYRAPVGSGYPSAPIATTDDTIYTDATASNGVQYKYKIRTANPVPNPYLESASLNATPMAAPELDAMPGLNQVQLLWESIEGASSYRVYQSIVFGDLGTVVNSPTLPNVTRSPLSNGIFYYFTVQARNATGSGPMSAQVGVKPLALPTAVSSVTLTPGNSQIGISFPAIADASGYYIYRSTTSNTYDYSTPTLTATGSGTVTATDRDLTNGVTYYYVVRTVNTSGISASSTEASSIPITPPVLEQPLQGDGSISLSWSATTGASSYEVYRASSALDFGATPLAITNASTRTYIDNTAVNGTTYYYKIVAANPVSNPSLTSDIIAAAAMPTPILHAIPSPTQVALSWDTIAGAIDYTIYQSSSAGQLGSALPVTTSNSLNRTGLTTGETYFFRVQARNATGNGPISAPLEVIPVSAPVLAPASSDSNGVTLSWTFNGSASSYEIYRTTYGTSFGSTPIATSTTKAYTDGTAVVGSDYSYRVRVANPTPNALLTSNIIRVTPKTLPTLDVIAGNGAVTSKWTTVEGTVQYTVYVSEIAGQLGSAVASVGNTTFSYTRTGLDNSKTYYFTVRAYTGSNFYSAQRSCKPISAATLNVAGLGTNSVSLSWTGVTDATGDYQIYRTLNSESFGTTPFAITDKDGRIFTDNTAQSGIIYKYKVRASNPTPNSYLDSNTVIALPIGIPVVTPVPGVSQVTLKWDAVSGATGYRIYQSEEAGIQGPLVQTISGSPATRTGLDNHKTYYFTVVPYNSTGTGQPAVQVDAIPRPIPAVVSPVTLTPSDSQIGISFSAVAYATQYRIYRATTSNGYNYSVPTLTVTGTGTVTAIDTGLVNGTTYYYVIRSANPGGASASSVQVSAVPALASPSTAPTLSITAGDSSASLSWTSVVGAAHYRVKRATVAGGPYTTLSNQIAFADFADAPLTNGTTYYYRVYAVNGSGNGPDSAEVSTTPLSLPAAVSTVTLTPGDAQIGISFAALANITEYRIYRATTSGGYNYTAPTLTTTGTGTITALDTGLTNNTRYYYVVRAVNSIGQGAVSTEVSAIPVAKPSAPILYATAGDGEVSLYWNSVSRATSYTLKRGTTANGPYTTIAPTLTETDFEDSTVTNGTTYYYVVAANNLSGEGPASNEKVIKPVPPAPETPENLRFERGNLQTTLLWDAVVDATGYKIASSATEEGLEAATFSTVTTTAYLHTGLTSGTTYYYRVKTYNVGGESEPVDIEVTAYTYGFIITPLTGLGTDRAGDTDTFTVQLAVAPTASVTLALSSDNTAEGTIDKSSLTFTTTNWNTPQTVTITGHNPGVGTRDKIYHIITGTVTSTDSHYQLTAVSVPDLTVINSVTATPPIETPPIPLPSSSVLSLVGTPTEDEIELSWTENTDLGFDHYELHRSLVEGFTPSEDSLVEQFDLQSDASVTDSQLESGTTYYYKLITKNELGQSATSNEIEASTAAIPPPADPPSAVVLSWDACQPTTLGQVGLVWTPNTASEFLKYEVHRSTTEDFTPSATTLRGEVLSESECKYIDDEVDAETDYFYKVVVVNRAKQTATSNEISITHNPPVI